MGTDRIMNEWNVRRNWDQVSLRRKGGGYAILLDRKPAKTPAGKELWLPARQLAERVADEWRQTGKIDAGNMPWTRRANTALDWVEPNRQEAVDAIAGYTEFELVCYRATQPEELVRRQCGAWDPVLDWAGRRFGGELKVHSGVMPLPQPADALRGLNARLQEMPAFELAGCGEMVTLSGSLLLALAALEGSISAEKAWRSARIDEEWQVEHWGVDEEQLRIEDEHRKEFLAAAEFASLSRQ
ncbi:MAG: ATPase [Rhodobacteraceae bacterium]|nr:ATPase [Paracoccaceae bacterium]